MRLRAPRPVLLLVAGLVPAMLLLQYAPVALAQQHQPAQLQATAPAAAAESGAPHASSEETLTFKTQTNLVLVPVVVLDKEGKSVGSLTREDFRILDDGKIQPVATFSLETNEPPSMRARNGMALGGLAIASIVGSAPSHFVAYLFDDLHLNGGELIQVRQAAEKHLAATMGPQDRKAVYTTSGDVQTDFTNDVAGLKQAMDRIKPALVTALQAIQDANAIRQRTMLAIQLTVRRVAAMPGSRTLILVSPGFQIGDDHVEQNTAIDLALKQNVVINALDARGLYTEASGADVEGSGPSDPQATTLEEQNKRIGMIQQSAVLAELVGGTGGRFFHNNNDLPGGFDLLSTQRKFVYMLGFNPGTLKQPGRFHKLRVEMIKREGLTIQARPGYFESTAADSPEESLSTDLQQALFSHTEVHTVPISVNAKYAHKDVTNRLLLVTTHIDLRGILFHKMKSMNIDHLTLVCGLFDLNGNYIQGKKRDISMRLSDQAVSNATSGGMNVTTSFDVQPGVYVIRIVLRDAGSGLLSSAHTSGFVQ